MRVAYVLGRFPVLSETFVAGEIHELERLGHEVRVFALGEGDREAASLLGGVRSRVNVMARERRFAAVLRILSFALMHPSTTAAGLVRSLRLGGPNEARAYLRALSWAFDAWIQSADRLHAHFADEPARVAHRLHLATGVPFGVTIHAHDLFPVAADVAERLRVASWIVTVCEYNRRELLAALPWLADRRLEIVPCGVDAEAFRRARPYLPRPIRLVAVGRLVPKKGFRDLVEAARLLRQRGVEAQVRICGDGPLRAELQDAIDASDLRDRVTLLGALPHQAVRDEIEAATALVLPAVIAHDGDRDSMPVVLKEAMSLEVPAIASRVAGLPEAVDESCGWLVPPGDPRALAAVFAELADASDDRLRDMGRRGRERVRGSFRLEVLTARLAAILESATARAPGAES